MNPYAANQQEFMRQWEMMRPQALGSALGLDSARNMLAPAKPTRPDFGPNQLAWIEKHLGIKSLVRK